MEDQPRQSKPSTRNKSIYASILLLSTAVGAAFIASVRPPKLNGDLVIYEIFLATSARELTSLDGLVAALSNSPPARSEETAVTNASFDDLQIISACQLLTTIGVPASFSSLQTGTKTWGLRLDVIPTIAEDQISTKLKVYAGKHWTTHQLVQRRQESRVIKLSVGDLSRGNHYYAIISTRPASIPNNAPLARATAPSSPNRAR